MRCQVTERERQMLDDVLHVLFGRAVRIASVTVLCFAAGLAATQAWGPHYTATVRLMAPARQDGPGRSARDQAEVLHDPAAVTRVLPALLAARPRPGFWHGAAMPLGLAAGDTPASFASRAAHALTVRAAPGTNVIQASFTWSDPGFAATALNLIVAGHQRTGAAGAVTQAAASLAQAHAVALQAELDGLDRHLTGSPETEALRADLARAHGQTAALRATADQVRLDRALAQQRADALRTTYQGGGWVEMADADDGPHPLASGLAALLEKRAQLLAAGKQDTAALRALDREMARARAQAYAAALQIADGRSGALDDRLARLTADIANGEAATDGLQQQLSRTDLLTQARQAKAADLAVAQAALVAVRARQTPGWQTAELVSPAAPPAAADWPQPSSLAWLSAAFGLAAGLASAQRAEARRRTIERPDDLPRRLGIDLLATLSELPVQAL